MVTTGWQRADRKMQMIKCGWKNVDDIMEIENMDRKMQVIKMWMENADGKKLGWKNSMENCK